MVTTITNLTTRMYQGRIGGRVDIIGIHTMEAPELPQTAENVAEYFKRVNASAHWCVDSNSRVRSVQDQNTAWTLPGANSRSLNLELAGYARQSPEDWTDEYSINELEIAALCSAEWCIKYGIPVRKLTDAQIANKEKGFAGHVDVNRVYKQSSHWDPGPHFPWNYFLGRVNAHIAAISGKPAPTPPPAVPVPTWNNSGFSISYIAARQTQLNVLGYNLVVDGKLGPATRGATKDFQSKHGLTVDGLPGPKTAAKLNEVISAKPAARPNCVALQQAVRTAADNVWGPTTDKHCDALREASAWGGHDFPYGKAFAQVVVGASPDGIWGKKSVAAHDRTVANVQTALKSMGFDPGNIDGVWGNKSENAYQAARRACRV